MQKRHRTFIAINLPSDIKKYLARYQEKFSLLPAKWTPKDNLHITLLFLGDLTDEQLGEVCVTVKEIAKNHGTFNVVLQHVGYGPDDKIPPRMLWVSGEKSKELSLLKTDLQEVLLEKVHFVPDAKAFSPHITLARISAFAWRQINPEERPEVAEAIDMSFTVESIEVMESELKKGGPQYVVIESHQLQ
jgi:RNA 2',3'-cyclic 3'-phosphodiesterase